MTAAFQSSFITFSTTHATPSFCGYARGDILCPFVTAKMLSINQSIIRQSTCHQLTFVNAKTDPRKSGLGLPSLLSRRKLTASLFVDYIACRPPASPSRMSSYHRKCSPPDSSEAALSLRIPATMSRKECDPSKLTAPQPSPVYSSTSYPCYIDIACRSRFQGS